MRLLIIGGTVFLGRHLVSLALSAGHQVTTLNRGSVVLEEQANVEKLIADRNGDLSVLNGRTFDAVIDTCAYHPDTVYRLLSALAGAVGTYVFISTISTYGDFTEIGISEESPIKYTPPGEQGNYGSLKADCENVVTKMLIDRSLIIRPGLIAGPYDPTDRFTYWPARFARGGKIAIPERLDRAVQFIDVRDLAAWVLARAEAQARGIYIATGPEERSTIGDLMDACQRTARVESEVVRVEDAVLLKEGVIHWTELPLWIPDTMKNFAGVMRLDRRKAAADGLTCRRMEATIADTLAWDQTRDPALPRQAGLSPEKEAVLLRQPKLDQRIGRAPLPGAGLR
ncbi:MAG: NAD-dependent epimerase/dehydratase family protein [Candidatus Melainabacteria bacterium]|nr:NAD-dependent epimerase/dehydratase family protein [Candidatus Melainabacteria bacterium]